MSKNEESSIFDIVIVLFTVKLEFDMHSFIKLDCLVLVNKQTDRKLKIFISLDDDINIIHYLYSYVGMATLENHHCLAMWHVAKCGRQEGPGLVPVYLCI